jgi:hypothetical protein
MAAQARIFRILNLFLHEMRWASVPQWKEFQSGVEAVSLVAIPYAYADEIGKSFNVDSSELTSSN